MSSQESASTSAQVREMAAMLFELIETQINRDDTLFASAVAALKRGMLVNLFDDTLPPLIRLTAFLAIPMFLALLVSAIYALIVAHPILHLPKRKRTFYFFERIAETSASEFIASFPVQTPDEIREKLLNEVYTISLIAQRKLARVQRSFDFLIVALVLWAVLQVVMAITR